jgi:hypothetical protein
MVDDRASSLRMTSRRLHHALFLTSLLAGCYASSGAPEDAGTSRPDASVALDAPRGAAQCGEAALLALDTTEAIDVTQAIVPELGSCWSGDEAYVFRRIEVPPLTGVEIRTEGADAPVVHLHEECSLGDGDRCVRFGPSGFFSPGEPVRTTYYGNPERTARSLYVAFWWVGEGETPFRVITRSSPVAEHGACDRPEPLAPNDLVTAGSARGGTYESWSCWYLPESHFYDVALPAMHVAVPLEGSQLLRATGGCDCAPLSSSDPLVNLSDAATMLHLEADPTQAIGLRFEPLPAVASCERAAALPLDGIARPVERFPRIVSGLGRCAYNDPHHYAVEIPPGRALLVEASLLTPYPSIQLLEACGADACTSPEPFERTDSSLRVTFRNESDAPLTRILVVGSDGPAELPLEGTLSARLID